MKPSDESLLSWYVFDGNEAAFNRLHERYRDRVINVIWRYCGDFQKAEEAAQDTFLQVYQQAFRFRYEGKVASWIFRIAVNEAKEVLRKARGKRAIISKAVSLASTPADVEAVSPEGSQPDQVIERREFEKRLQSCLNSLSSRFREVLILDAVENLPYREISEILGCRIGTVASRLSRARREFSRKFKSGTLKNKWKNKPLILIFTL